MTKKDYKALAQIIKDTEKQGNTLIIPNFIKRLTNYLKIDNYRFDYHKFIVACGLSK